MANPEHLRKLGQGVDAWNEWVESRRRNGGASAPDLFRADLANANLRGANLQWARLTEANLRGANLTEANLQFARLRSVNLKQADLTRAKIGGAKLLDADLTEASLVEAELIGTDLTESRVAGADLTRANVNGGKLKRANLQRVDFTEASLVDADLTGTKLTRAVLKGAYLIGAVFRKSNLFQTDFSNTTLESTVFCDISLKHVKGLDSCMHKGPSSLGIDTVFKSAGIIPDVFLRGCGVPEQLITYARSLVIQPIEFYSCFISYSSFDREFADRLHADLQAKRLRCWYAPEDLKIGQRFHEEIEQSIRIFDKVMIVLSANSVESRWVEREVNAALEREDHEKRTILFPIRIDDAVMETGRPWAADIRRTRHIGDFSGWKNHDSYSKALDRLLRDLKSEKP